MAKKIVKRKKIKFIPFLIVLVILLVLSFSIYKIVKTPIKNIIIKNNTYIKDDTIIDLAGIKDYPAFYLVNTMSMSKKIKESPYIENVQIKRKFFHVLEITIEEKKPLFINDTNKEVVFSDNSTIKNSKFTYLFRIPRLINYVPEGKYESFIKKMGEVNQDILGKISDIEYVPNDFDKDRFLLYMDDDNMVYLTLTKFEHINYYNDVLEQLGKRHGILYLDSGNHFQIKE